MKRTVLAGILALAVAVPSTADVTIRQSTSGKGLGLAGSGTSTTYVKGLKMRTDTVMSGNTMTSIFDVENQKMISFDAKKKNADVWDMQAFAAELSKSVDASEMRASIKPNGRTKEIAGRTAHGFDLSVAVPSTLGGEGGMAMTVNLRGPMWVVKGMPGADDYMAFYKAAVEKGWIFSDPRAAKGSPGQAKAIAEMYRQLAAVGLPYETEMTISIEGDGPMAAMMAKMGGMSMTTTVESVDTAAIDDALFSPPPGYKLTPRK